MRIPKFLLTLCAATVCASFTSARAADTPAQAAARASLEQKMNELNAQSSQTNAAPVAPQNETPPVQSAPSVSAAQTPAPFAAAASTSTATSDTEAQQKAQAALEQKMRELDLEAAQQKQGAPILINSSGVVAPEPASQPTAMTPPVVQAPIETRASSGGGGSDLFEPASPSAANAGNQSAANAAVQQKMAQLNQGQTAQFQPAKPVYSGAAAGFAPMVAPPLPISPDTEAQLQALTAKYMANQISPEEYFKQREAILGKR